MLLSVLVNDASAHPAIFGVYYLSTLMNQMWIHSFSDLLLFGSGSGTGVMEAPAGQVVYTGKVVELDVVVVVPTNVQQNAETVVTEGAANVRTRVFSSQFPGNTTVVVVFAVAVIVLTVDEKPPSSVGIGSVGCVTTGGGTPVNV